MKNLSTPKKWLLLAVLAVTTMVGCQKETLPENDETLTESSVYIPKSKEVSGMVVVDSSIIVNTESLALLDSASSSELIFRSKPLQADSMGEGFVLVTSTSNDKLPYGLLVRSLGTSEDAEGFKVKIEAAELTDYILQAELSGTVSLDPESEVSPEIYVLSKENQDSARTTLPALNLTSKVSRTNQKMATITGPAVNISVPYTFAGGSQAVFNFAGRPTATYNISINVWLRRFYMSFGGNLAINNIGLTLTARAPLELNFNGDEVFIPIPIPVGPILITPYFSVTPYVQAGVAAVGTVALTSQGNIGFTSTQNGWTPGGSVNATYSVNKPDFDLYTTGILSTGVQATFGVGLYGKTIYTQVQAKVGPKLEMKNDILAKQTTVTASVPATVNSSAGVSLLFWNIVNTNYELFNKNLYSNQWVYNWPI